MKYVKCPRCQINYITEDEKLCQVCLDEINNVYSFNSYCMICGSMLADDEYDVCNKCLENLNEIVPT